MRRLYRYELFRLSCNHFFYYYFLVFATPLSYHPVHGVCMDKASVCYHSSRVGHVAALLAVRAVNHPMKPSVSRNWRFGSSALQFHHSFGRSIILGLRKILYVKTFTRPLLSYLHRSHNISSLQLLSKHWESRKMDFCRRKTYLCTNKVF